MMGIVKQKRKQIKKVKTMTDYDITKIEADKELLSKVESGLNKSISSVNEDFCNMINTFFMFVNNNRDFSIREMHIDYTDKDKIVLRNGPELHNDYSTSFSWYRGKNKYSDVFTLNEFMGKHMMSFIYAVVS